MRRRPRPAPWGAGPRRGRGPRPGPGGHRHARASRLGAAPGAAPGAGRPDRGTAPPPAAARGALGSGRATRRAARWCSSPRAPATGGQAQAAGRGGARGACGRSARRAPRRSAPREPGRGAASAKATAARWQRGGLPAARPPPDHAAAPAARVRSRPAHPPPPPRAAATMVARSCAAQRRYEKRKRLRPRPPRWQTIREAQLAPAKGRCDGRVQGCGRPCARAAGLAPRRAAPPLAAPRRPVPTASAAPARPQEVQGRDPHAQRGLRHQQRDATCSSRASARSSSPTSPTWSCS